MSQLSKFTVLYARLASEVREPDVFQCQASDGDAAEDQCIDAVPDCMIVWVAETNDPEAAKREYYSHGLLSPGDWVIWRHPSDDTKSEPAIVESLGGDLVALRGRSGRSIECPYTQTSPAEPVVPLQELTDELHRRARGIRTILESALENQGNSSDQCQLRATLSVLLNLEQHFNGIEERDLQHTLADGSAEMLQCTFQPEAVQDGHCVPIDPPDESCGRTTWSIPPWELEGVSVGGAGGHIEGDAPLRGNAPAWIRGWYGPYTVRQQD